MDPAGLDRLTDSERTVLRELLLHGHQGAVARALDLSPETVKTHLRNAREKCGASTSFALARLLADHEAHPPKGVIPRKGGETDASPPPHPGPSEPKRRYDLGDEVREERQVFDYHGMPISIGAERREHGEGDEGAFRRLLAAGALVLIAALAIILAFPLSESFQRLANVIDPPRH